MIPELGHFALVLAFLAAVLQSVLPVVGHFRQDYRFILIAKPAARAQFVCLLVAFACLVTAFVQHDFSVAYVAQNSNSHLPLLYRISAVWGAHEGSLLLWALTLATWTLAVTLFSRQIPETMLSRVLSVMGWISIGFLLFLLITSNPFTRLLPAPPEGRDLNPLLQDPGLAMHPPMLYMGYVGFSVAFAFAIAAMWGGKLDSAWARWSRPWTTIAWIFLTLGITLGSWWAYYELGWGGWWFWDPVENASFMPWLVGTALLHSLAVTDKRSSFKAWTVLLALFAFSLSLLGTFLVRSGVLTSVHAFTSDPQRGIFILVFLGLVVGASLLLYSLRAPLIRSHGGFALFSRETLLLLNNIALVVLAIGILGGTLFPIVTVAFDLGKYSVGAPYFNFIFVLLSVPLALLLASGQLVRWKKDNISRLYQRSLLHLMISIALGSAIVFSMPFFSWQALLGIIFACWIALATLDSFFDRFKHQSLNLATLRQTPLACYGSHLAHLGVVVFCVGITLTSVYSTKKDVLLKPGESWSLGGYQFQFEGAKPMQGPNYHGDEGLVIATKNNVSIARLYPQKRRYFSQGNPMTEAAIDAGLLRDLFVALGEPRGTQGAWTLRLYHKPFIRWIWLGAIIMALGGLLALLDKRYRRRGGSKQSNEVAAQ